MTVREVMARFPETYHIFHRFRMDGPWEARCTLEAVAATHGRDLAALLAALNGAVHAARHVPTGSGAVTP
jgi:hypothetical protein